MHRNVVETIIGGIVLLVAAIFLVFAYSSTDVTPSAGYEVVARFDRIGDLQKGSDVHVSGIKVGTVVRQNLDPETFLAVVHMNLDSDVQLPKDTSARIESTGLLGGARLALEPGGDEDNLEDGDEIIYTQGAVSLMDLIGQAIFSANQDDRE